MTRKVLACLVAVALLGWCAGPEPPAESAPLRAPVEVSS